MQTDIRTSSQSAEATSSDSGWCDGLNARGVRSVSKPYPAVDFPVDMRHVSQLICDTCHICRSLPRNA